MRRRSYPPRVDSNSTLNAPYARAALHGRPLLQRALEAEARGAAEKGRRGTVSARRERAVVWSTHAGAQSPGSNTIREVARTADAAVSAGPTGGPVPAA